MNEQPLIIIFNPWSARNGYRIPNSILQIAASIDGQFNYVFVDGNRESEPLETIKKYIRTGAVKYFASTVMPGPQLKQAIPFTKYIREHYPDITTIWGGYFASNQYKSIMDSGFVDFIIDGPGDIAFPELLHALESNQDHSLIRNLIFKKNDQVVKTVKNELLDQDKLPAYPYTKLFDTYSAEGYLKKTFLGNRTAAYHSSFGCPFTCSFCAVVPIYNSRWKGKSAANIYKDVSFLKANYGIDAVEFHDNNFFVSQKRTVEFSKLVMNDNIQWWGEGRIDTINKYSDESLALMREAGCRMIFLGAESGNDDILQQMDKGGTQTAEQIEAFAVRMKEFDIIPEYSFVLGMPGASEAEVMEQIESDIQFIRKIKSLNPNTEIIIYLYSPVPTEGSELFDRVKEAGFHFPQKLEDWLNPSWENFDLRKNPLTPWLTPKMVDKIQGFETVLNGYFPTVSDYKLTTRQRRLMQRLTAPRYKYNLYRFPYELKILQKFWLKYRQPEIEGFYMESE